MKRPLRTYRKISTKNLLSRHDFESWREYYYYLRSQTAEEEIRRLLADEVGTLERIKLRNTYWQLAVTGVIALGAFISILAHFGVI